MAGQEKGILGGFEKDSLTFGHLEQSLERVEKSLTTAHLQQRLENSSPLQKPGTSNTDASATGSVKPSSNKQE